MDWSQGRWEQYDVHCLANVVSMECSALCRADG